MINLLIIFKNEIIKVWICVRRHNVRKELYSPFENTKPSVQLPSNFFFNPKCCCILI